jgi:hypothetical protein
MVARTNRCASSCQEERTSADTAERNFATTDLSAGPAAACDSGTAGQLLMARRGVTGNGFHMTGPEQLAFKMF